MQTVVAAQTAYAKPIGLPVPGEKEKWLDRAVITAGFAEHFLMDAFSAGRLFSKDDFITVLKRNLDARCPLSPQFLDGSVRDPSARRPPLYNAR
jgi:hypothetical protein